MRPASSAPPAMPPMNAARTVPTAVTVLPIWSVSSRAHTTS